jgi:uncharacterized membrane protein
MGSRRLVCGFGGAMLTTGLKSGFFYAYGCSVTRGLALLPDGRYIAALQTINATVSNGVFAFSFFGAAPFMILRSSFTFRGSVRAGRARLLKSRAIRADSRGVRADERGAGQGRR